jgi:hypothetical protein
LIKIFSVKIGNLIEAGLQERRLKYIRLIGAGSMTWIPHSELYIYDKEMRDEDVAALDLLRKEAKGEYLFDNLYSHLRRIFANYQMALVKRVSLLL